MEQLPDASKIGARVPATGFEPVVCLRHGLIHSARAVDLPGTRARSPLDGSFRVVVGAVAPLLEAAGPAPEVIVDRPLRVGDGEVASSLSAALRDRSEIARSITFLIRAHDARLDLAATLELVEAVRSLGFGVGLDGVRATPGYLSLIDKVPFDLIRLDADLVANMLASTDGLGYATDVLRAAATAGVPAAAIGVESHERAAWLRDLGCRFASGPVFGVARPWLVHPTPHPCPVLAH
jgi:EAL domain